jgi:hypothetical protein
MQDHKESVTDGPDPLDDHSQVPDEALERRFILRVVLGTAFLFSLYGFSIVARASVDNPSGRNTGLAVLIGIGIILLYLGLVRIDSGKWGLVHPVIPWGIGRIRMDRKFTALLVFANIALLLTALIAFFSGFFSTKHGPRSLLILVMVWFIINAGTIFVFTQLGDD